MFVRQSSNTGETTTTPKDRIPRLGYRPPAPEAISPPPSNPIAQLASSSDINL